MGLFSSLSKAAQTFVEDLNTPESFKKGQKFEDYVRNVIFTRDRYKLLSRTHSYDQNHKDYVLESLNPDFKFECVKTKKQFHVEAKFRSWFYNGGLEIFSNDQFKRLKELNKKEDVFVAIGIDNEPDYPTYVCLVPMKDIKSRFLSEEFLEDYDIASNVSISPKRLWQLVNLNDVMPAAKNKQKDKNSGYCIRCQKRINLNIEYPLCKDCYKEWNKYKNYEYKEKFCHICGEKNNSTLLKPVCYNCYKKHIV